MVMKLVLKRIHIYQLFQQKQLQILLQHLQIQVVISVMMEVNL